MSGISTEIKKVQEKIDVFLAAYLQDREQTVLVTEITRMVKGGGKRIRPFILCSTYQLLGGKDESLAIKIGAAIELFHTFALIHDDIIDRSDLRRNVTTVRKEVGDNAAILVGDVCLGYANDIFTHALLSSNLTDSVKIALQNRWHQMQEEVITGEYLDSHQTIFNVIKQDAVDFEKLEKQSMKIMDYKTARYTIVHPLLFAATLVAADKDLQTHLSEYGTKLGIAFQIKDDLLGIFGDEKAIGKPIDSDVKEGKVTLLMLKLLQQLPRKEWVKEKLDNIHFVRERMKSFRVDAFFEEEIARLTKQAVASIKKTTLNDKEFFYQFSEYTILRNK